MRRLRPPASSSAGGLFGPEAVEVLTRRIKAGDTWFETLAITGYPREVGPGWLAPLLSLSAPVDLSIHVEPLPNELAAGRLKRQLARLESTRRMQEAKAALSDPELETAASDAAELMAGLARGEGRLFRVGLYLTVRAASEEKLDAEVGRVSSICSSMLLATSRTTFRALEGWTTTLPLALDPIRLRRTFDTKALAACFPFGGAAIGTPDGILYGQNPVTGDLVLLDRFALENHNQVVLGHSGKGKSFFVKLQILRSLYRGIEVLVIDPENEYMRLAEAVGGSVIRLGPDGDRINPLDLSDAGSPDALVRQALFVHAVVASLLGALSEKDKAALDRAVLSAYEAAGITSDPRTHSRPAPLLAEVAEALRRGGGRPLAERLDLYTTGSHRGLFNAPTGVRPEGHLVVFSLRDVPRELKAPATLLALETVWRRVCRSERRPRIVVVDEAWLLVQSGAGAAFLQRLAKSARKHWCGLTTVTQDVSDVLSSDLGKAVVTNAASQVLLGQHPQAIEALAEAFRLSEGERSYVVTCPPGQGLLCVGTERAPIEVLASELETALATSRPSEVAQLEAADT